MKRVLIVEDDTIIRNEIAALLRNSGYEAFIPLDFSNVTGEVKAIAPHLILLDINLPVKDGYKICSDIRAFSNVPIIFVTSRNTDMDELNGMMIGGDDFITKPYNVPILLARISTILKRVYGKDELEYIACKGIKLYIEAGKVEYQKNIAELTKNETRILSFLIKHQGKIVPRADLIEYLWDNRMYVDDNALSVNITRIRAKLERIGVVDFIKTKHRQGYMI
jgi:DNA-binding response OmpR family regulator